MTARILLPRPRVRWRGWLRVLGWGVAAVVALIGTLAGFAGLGSLLVFFILLGVPELLFPRHSQPVNRPGLMVDLLWSVVGAWVRLLFMAAILAVVFAAIGFDRQDGFENLPGLFKTRLGTLPVLVQAVLGGLLFDFVVYWMHRLFHAVPSLWRLHAVHHSIRVMDWAAGGRNHPLQEVAFTLVPAFVVIGLGFDPLPIASLAVLFALLVPFTHTNVRWRLRPLRGLVITPEFHHWHHAADREAWDTNFSAYLPIWDLLFGTYYMPEDKRPQAYGTPDAVPEDFVGQLVYPFSPGPFEASLEHPGHAVKIPGGVVFTAGEPEMIG